MDISELVEGTIVEGEKIVFTLRALTDAEEVDDENEKKEHSAFPHTTKKLYKQIWVVDEVDDSYDRDNISEDVYDRLFHYYFLRNFRLEDLDFRSDDVVAYFSLRG